MENTGLVLKGLPGTLIWLFHRGQGKKFSNKNTSVNVIKKLRLPFTNVPDKLDCLSLAGHSSLALCLIEHLPGAPLWNMTRRERFVRNKRSSLYYLVFIDDDKKVI